MKMIWIDEEGMERREELDEGEGACQIRPVSEMLPVTSYSYMSNDRTTFLGSSVLLVSSKFELTELKEEVWAC